MTLPNDEQRGATEMMNRTQMTEEDIDPILVSSECSTEDALVVHPQQHYQEGTQNEEHCPSESHDLCHLQAATRKRTITIMFLAVLGQATAFMLIFTAFKTVSHLLVSTRDYISWADVREYWVATLVVVGNGGV
ncbi:hypothetical protein Pmani_021225 [Petrolisthes manimaculis]|uniref:Uncharacterized protein n=1 Tax=Petrolisthes manimaculis TaxID=1843537 RepID=A0AAE1PGQ6_9EUCA|nr:hypothetical protein Pmani_021225 [Petrolisthes manimaculis]